MRIVIVAAAAALGVLCTPVLADTLERVRDTGVFRIGFREDAPPFAFRNGIGEPDGYTVALCRRIAAATRSKLDLPSLAVEYVPVTAENRFDAVIEGRIDVLCGATTVTLSRRESVDFSVYTFLDGASVLFRTDGPASFDKLAGHAVGVRAGTTTEEALRASLAEFGIDAEVVAVESHLDGIGRLERNLVTAYFADRAILMYLLRESERASRLRLSDRYFTEETYAIALERGDDAFRLLVDRTLSRIYRAGEIYTLFAEAFGPDARPTKALEVLYSTNGLPE